MFKNSYHKSQTSFKQQSFKYNSNNIYYVSKPTVINSINTKISSYASLPEKKHMHTIDKRGPKVRWVPKNEIVLLVDVMEPSKWILVVHNERKVYVPKLKEPKKGTTTRKRNIKDKITDIGRKGINVTPYNDIIFLQKHMI